MPGVVVRRATIETTPSLAPVAMATSLGLASRGAADPTMVLSRARRERGSKLGVGLALFGVALVSSLAVLAVALFPEPLARARAAVAERLNPVAVPDDVARTPATAPVAVAAVAPAAETTPAAPSAEVAATPAAEVASAPSAEVTAAPAAMPTVSPDALPPAPSSAPGRAVTAAPPAEEVAPTMTRVVLPSYAKGHRVFVDGRVVGEGAEPITVACGKHKIQIGSRGRPRARNLPCGGELTLD
ncbi:MAG: hypothetical protein KF894_05865 [Labilithrix sp.]|nr:hypothetical protein [Labilithrix sp.]